MKKHLLLILFLAAGVFSQALGQLQVPNGDFESWDDFTTFMNPTGWDSPNPETSIVGITPVTQETTDVFLGTFSARLETKQVITFKAPGLLTLGDFEVDFLTTEFTISGGIPFTETPDKLMGHYKYTSVNNDFWTISSIFTKWNTTTAERDTIGGSVYIGAAAAEWTAFESNIVFFPGTTPDTMNIICISSNILDAQVGSTLLIDGLEFYDGVGFEENALENSVNFYHNQADYQLNLLYKFDTPKNIEVRVYNVMGQQVLIAPSLLVMNYTQTIHLDGLKQGIYMVEVNDGQEKIVKKIIL